MSTDTKSSPPLCLNRLTDVIRGEGDSLLKAKARQLCFAKRKSPAKTLSVQLCVSSGLVLPEDGRTAHGTIRFICQAVRTFDCTKIDLPRLQTLPIHV